MSRAESARWNRGGLEGHARAVFDAGVILARTELLAATLRWRLLRRPFGGSCGNPEGFRSAAARGRSLSRSPGAAPEERGQPVHELLLERGLWQVLGNDGRFE